MPVDHYENFPVASWLLPRHLRAPVIALYRFARSADDIADEGDAPYEQRLQQLDAYRAELDVIAAGGHSNDPLFCQLAEAVSQHDLPVPLLRDLLDAFTQDLTQTHYATFAELRDYCRRSADPVGRLLLRLFRTQARAENQQQLAWSDAICTSLQLINHWQDIGIDWKKQRVYLPQEDLQRFGVDEAQIAVGLVDDKWRALLRFEVDRTRALMLEGAPLGRSLPGRIGLELRLIVAGGLRILEKIEAVDYDVFSRRPVLHAMDWPRLMWRALMT
ncbi:MAG TPA: squalene synthase HpnC [Rhodocyclaceae bacterium]|nr:squalene synthase HpnC [Rhodocyclaceae bacterium]